MIKLLKESLLAKALAGVIVVLLPILTGFAVMYTKNSAYLRQRVLDTITVIAEAYEGQVYQFLEMSKRRVQDFSSDGFIKNQLQKISGGNLYAAKALSKHLVKNKIALDKTIHTINIISMDGRIVASTDNADMGKDVSGKTFFTKGRESVTAVECNDGLKEFAEIAFSAPIFGKDTGRPIGVIVNFVNIVEVCNLLQGRFNKELGAISWGKGKGAWRTLEIYLVKKDKLMITESIFIKDAALKQTVDTLPVQRGLEANEEIAGFYLDYRGVEVVGVSMYIPSMKWTLLLEIDKDEVLAPIRNVFISIIIMAAVVTVMMVFLFIAFLKRIVKPLYALSLASNDIAAGNFDIDLPAQGSDEIGVLGRSFTYMAHHLKARTTALVESKERLADAQKISHIGNWEWIIVTNELYLSDEAYRIFGTPPEELGDAFEKLLFSVHPDDKDLVKKSFGDALSGKNPLDVEHRLLMKDGMARVVYEKAVVMRDAAGNAMRMVGTVQDVTERRLREDVLRKNEILLQSIFDNTTAVIYVKDVQGRHILVNKQFEKLFHLQHGEAEGKTNHDLWPAEVADTLWANDRKVIEAKTPLKLEECMALDDGLHTYISVKLPLYDSGGNVYAVCGISTDITESRKMYGQLRKLSQAVEQTVVSVIITDADGNIEFVNPKFSQISGYSREEVIGKTPRILKSGKTTPEEYKNLWGTITAGNAWQGELYNKRKNGEYYWELAQINPMKNEEGKITGYLAIKEDISDIKRAQQEQAALKEQLYHVQKLESVGRLAGGVAHDFNNVLMAIMGYGNLIQMEEVDIKTTHYYAKRLLDASERAVKLTQSLLTFSRKQASQLKPVNLNDIIARAEHLLLRLVGDDIKLEKNLAATDCIIQADSGQIDQVLMNLTANARDAMPDGGTLTIETTVWEPDDEFIRRHGLKKNNPYIVLSVSDTGMGMNEETRKRIFEPFFTTKEVGKGTGLGLAIIHGIVQQHHGMVEVQSEPGKGTTFNIYLPLIKLKVDEVVTDHLPKPAGGKETILLAEDEDDVRNVVRTICEIAGYKIIEAIDGEDAINKYKENSATIRLFVSDVMMPVKNGKAAYDEIRAIAPNMKAIFMSGYTEDIMNNKMILDERLHFITKPISPVEFLRKIRTVLDEGSFPVDGI